MLSTKQLRYFDALARHGHFARAAEHCAVTQPALSMQISRMEHYLGVVLVERRASGAVLTAAGSEVADRVAGILMDLRGLSEFAASCRDPFSLPIRLGVIPTVAPYLLPRLLPRFRAWSPAASLHVRETLTHGLLEDLHSAQLDAIVLALPVDSSELDAIEVRTDRFLLAVAVDDARYGQARVDPRALSDERLLLLEEGHCLRDDALAICRSATRNGADMLGASSLSTLVQMVASGYGVTLLPEIGAPYETMRGGVRLIRFTEPEPMRRLGLVWRRSSPRTAEFQALGGMIQDALADGAPPS